MFELAAYISQWHTLTQIQLSATTGTFPLKFLPTGLEASLQSFSSF